MRAVLDACVLYPTTLRGILLGAAKHDLITPIWSERLLEEWARAAARTHGDHGDMISRGEIALLQAQWPAALTEGETAHVDLPNLPDPDDAHVVLTALSAAADTIITFNLRDFPTRKLSPLGIAPRHPDAVLTELFGSHPAVISEICAKAFDEISQFPEAPKTQRTLLKKAGVPRLAKALVKAAIG